MRKDKVIMLLMALLCVGPISGSFAVMCCGSDGHVAVEPIFHDHCDCPEADESGGQTDSDGSLIPSSDGHCHCEDAPITSDAVLSVRDNTKLEVPKVFVQDLCQKSTSDCMTNPFSCPLSWSAELSSFFAPLRTIILLA
jgi:hypothetical protein